VLPAAQLLVGTCRRDAVLSMLLSMMLSLSGPALADGQLAQRTWEHSLYVSHGDVKKVPARMPMFCRRRL